MQKSDSARGASPSAIFFDLVGTLVARRPETEAGRAVLLPGLREAANRRAGVPLFIIANRSEMGSASTEVEAEPLFAAVHEHLGGRIVAARCCPHSREAGCPGHKPAPGLLTALAATHAVDLTRAWYVGDTLEDRECAHRAGVARFYWAQTFFAPAADRDGVPPPPPETQNATIRPAAAADLAGIVRIYNEAIEERISTCDLEAVSVSARRPWFERFDDRHPLHVAVLGERVVGWSAILPYDPKPGYAGMVEHSIYVERDARGAGLGRRLLEHLLQSAAALGHRCILGRIFRHNDPSLALHRQLGFDEAGVLPRAALLDGREADVVFMLRDL